MDRPLDRIDDLVIKIERYILLVLIALAALVLSRPDSALADDDRRVALVVGISEYESIYSLENAASDAETVAGTLEQIGFDVTLLQNSDRRHMLNTIDAFKQKADGADAALFYYAGHGFQFGGVNYLVPSDAVLTEQNSIETQTLSLNEIIAKLEDRRRQTLIFLDACRNNPLPASLRGQTGEGLSQVETGNGTFVAFATQPGNVTRDGSGDNSPFTRAFVDNVTEPGLSISDLMIQVRNDVQENTLYQQTPWDQSSLRSQFYFVPENEAGSGLTDEDREMLAALPPDLRAKFEERFGISLAPDEEETVEIASIQPSIQISVVTPPEPLSDTAGTSPLEDTLNSEAAGTNAHSPTVSETAIETASAEEPPDGAIADDVQDIANGSVAEKPIIPQISIEVVRDLSPNAPGASTEESREYDVAVLSPRDAPERISLDGASERPKSQTRTIELRSAEPASATRGAISAAENVNKPYAAVEHLAGSKETQTGVEIDRLVPANLAAEVIVGKELPKREGEIQVAALTPNDIDPALLPQIPDTAGEDDSGEITAESLGVEEDQLPRAVQAELARLGCYRSTVDNLWGANSARALLRYYANKKMEPEDSRPNPTLLSNLRQEEEVVCKVTRVAPKADPTPAAKTQRKSTPSVKKNASPKPAAKKRTTTRKPAATKPAVKKRAAPARRTVQTRPAPKVRQAAPRRQTSSSSGFSRGRMLRGAFR
ncbi:caspase family protein [Fulvimarina sp. MAC3]|uniref:caspase family protein n=1 Tax=Fulvimarina sp. MAC3 TaxID=3148887 RepID=UPI0031FD3459